MLEHEVGNCVIYREAEDEREEKAEENGEKCREANWQVEAE